MFHRILGSAALPESESRWIRLSHRPGQGIDHLQQVNEPETSRVELGRRSGWKRKKHPLLFPTQFADGKAAPSGPRASAKTVVRA
jgi:hypothetical protein